jgi:sugar/nucleoside kinase (ribokinase family)
MLIAAGDDASLEALAGHEVTRVAAATQTLRHEFPEGHRQQFLVQATGHTLTTDDVPDGWPEPATLILSPLMPEDIDVLDFIEEYPHAEVALLAQGLQRVVLPDGTDAIAHRAQPSSVLLDAARPNVTIFLSRDEIALWPAGAVDHLARRAARVVVTDGARGATVHDRAGTRSVPPAPAQPIDATGAGDVFAGAFILGLRAGEQSAGRLAAACAAAAVEVIGPAPLPSRAAIESRIPSPDESPDQSVS